MHHYDGGWFLEMEDGGAGCATCELHDRTPCVNSRSEEAITLIISLLGST